MTGGDTDPFESLEAEHSVGILRSRILNRHEHLDYYAHLDGTEHKELETISLEMAIDEVPHRVDIELRRVSWILVKAHNSQGTEKYRYYCDLNPKEQQPDAAPGRHAGQPDLSNEVSDDNQATSEIEKMIIVAHLLEDCITRGIDIKAYGN
jgi:hypothetical protein